MTLAQYVLDIIQRFRRSGTTTHLAKLVPDGAVVVVLDAKEADHFRGVLREQGRDPKAVRLRSVSSNLQPGEPRGPLFFDTQPVFQLAVEADAARLRADTLQRRCEQLDREVATKAAAIASLQRDVEKLQAALVKAAHDAYLKGFADGDADCRGEDAEFPDELASQAKAAWHTEHHDILQPYQWLLPKDLCCANLDDEDDEP